QIMRRWKLLNAFNQRVRSRNVVQTEETIQAIQIDLPFDRGMRKDRFDLRRKIDVVALAVEVERFDPETVACQDQPAIALGPNRECEHAAATGQTIYVPFAKRLQDDFRIAA